MPPRTRHAARALAAAQLPITIDWVYKNGRRDQRPRSEDDKFRLAVVAPSVAEVVMWVGGWLVDRAMLGWNVTVLIAQPAQQDLRPLEILGTQPLALEPFLTGRERLPPCDGVSVAADLYFDDARVRRHVLTRLHRRLSEFTLWGAGVPTDPTGHSPVTATALPVFEHRLSLAARAFKAHAVTAALGSATSTVSPTEAFVDARLGRGFRQSPLRVVARVDSDR